MRKNYKIWEEGLAMPFVPSLDQGMPIEVMKDFDTVVLFGRLAAVGASSLTVERIPGEKNFPVCQVGSAVLLRGYDARMDPVLLLGKVVSSSWVRCVVNVVKQIAYASRRESVRYPLTPPASVYTLDGGEEDEPQPCQLLNLSIGGACIVSEHSYEVEQPLRLQVELTRTAVNTAIYRCQVVRETPRGGGCFEYGLCFVQMDEASRSDLVRDLRTIHREMGEKLRRQGG